MKKILTQAGWIAYEATAAEIRVLGGVGICDGCNRRSENGYLVPVLNHWICPPCFEEWVGCSKFYPEDIPIERLNAQRYEKLIPLETSA